MWLAFDAAYLGDKEAAERMIARAETAANGGGHEPFCTVTRVPGLGTAALVKNGGQVPGFDGDGPLFAAADAAWKSGHGGLGFVASDGRWRFQSWGGGDLGRADPSGPARVLILELRAAFMAIRTLSEDASRSTLLLDSQGAVSYLRAWQSGNVRRMPDGYSLRVRNSGAPPTLVRLAEAVAELPGLKIHHVKGHVGHPLNEAADSLAKLGMRKPPDAKSRAEGLVKAFLGSWQAEHLAQPAKYL
ncbi:ribonuclease HI [Microbispora sp. NPDC049125]|uniref:ribonuclease HI n=1 Tax=Microbispora sp. NPDC049125 TaxID=3154929 RepID=UPI00346715EE